jgi:DNA end-binding protein Ku
MSARAMLKTTLYVGDHAVPVRIFAAVEDQRVHFRLLHVQDLQPVVQQMVHPRTGQPVAPHEVQKGYEVEPRRFVVLDPDALASLEPPNDRRIDVSQVVPRSALPDACLGRPYYLGPDESDAAYFALAHALAEDERVGIVHFTMRKRRYNAALLGEHGYLMLVTLLDPRTLVLPASLPAAEPKGLDPQQLGLAEQLVEIMRAPFEPAAHRDDHRARVLELVERKRAGEAIPTDLPPPPPATEDLLRTLERSLRRAQEQDVA